MGQSRTWSKVINPKTHNFKVTYIYQCKYFKDMY